ncbi:MAG: hypothetical protein ABI585_07245 [Betaproteobacteria bacterium]
MPRIAYLAENTIYVVSLEKEQRHAHTEDRWILPRGRAHETYAGLACGNNGGFLLHVSRFASEAVPPSAKAAVIFAELNARTVKTVFADGNLSLTWPRLSPDGKWIAASGVREGMSALVLISTLSGDTQIFPELGMSSAQSWSNDSLKLLLTGLDESRLGWQVIEFDLLNRSLVRLPYFGGKPTWSPSQRGLAYLSNDHKELIIVDAAGVETARLRGFFKDLVGWLDERRLVFVTGTLYQDRIGIVDLASGDTQEFALDSNGEIAGACLLK